MIEALEKGKAYFVRAIPFYYVGEFDQYVSVGGVPHIRLIKAAWVADTGRFYDAIQTGNFREVEPFPHYVDVPADAEISLITTVNLPLSQK